MKMLRKLVTFQKAVAAPIIIARQAQRKMVNAHTQRCIEEHQRRMQQQRHKGMIHALAAERHLS
jgi:hypothetical protein